MMSMVIFAHPLTYAQFFAVLMIVFSLVMEFADKIFAKPVKTERPNDIEILSSKKNM